MKFIAAIVLMLIGRVTILAETPVSASIVEDPVVITVNGEPVSKREYRLVMDRQKASVFAFFKEHHDLDDHPGYWSEDATPPSPLARLRQVVLDELVQIKVQQGLAKQKGLVKDITYAAFTAELARENERRAVAVAGKQIIYGPRQYPESAFYYIRFKELSFQLKQALGREVSATIGEPEIAAFYEENKGLFEEKPLANFRPNIIKALQARAADRMIKALCASAAVEINEASLRDLVPRSDPAPHESDRTVGLVRAPTLHLSQIRK